MVKFLKIGCGSIIVLFALLVVLGIFVGNDRQQSSEKAPSSTTTKSENKKEEQKNVENKKFSIGDELTIGKVTFKVNSISEVKEISAANGYMKYTPDANGAVFFNVNVTVRNNGTDMIQTDSSFFKLKASNGAEYSPSSVIVADEKYFMFEGINPGLSLTGNVVFEVPSGLKGLDLQVQTGYWGTEIGTINLN